MPRIKLLVACACLASALVLGQGPAAHAANMPTFRDCSLLVPGVDEDFVELFGVTLSPQDKPVVPATQQSVQVEASESSDPGDSSGHVTLKVTISAPGVPTQTVSGAAVDRVFLTVPLVNPVAGLKYTIAWAAVFDTGQHPCPNRIDTENPKPAPFFVSVT